LTIIPHAQNTLLYTTSSCLKILKSDKLHFSFIWLLGMEENIPMVLKTSLLRTSCNPD